jgi:hypothetical protein
MTAPTTIDGAMMTDEQIMQMWYDTPAERFGDEVEDSEIIAFARALLSASKPAAPQVHQVSAGGNWTTVTEAQYNAWSGKKRIAHAPSADAQDERGAALTDADLSDLYSFAKGEPRPEWIDHAREFIAARAALQSPSHPTDAAAPAQSERPDPDDIQGWSVTVNVNAVDVLTIGHNSLSGIDNIGDFAPVVRNCAEHLLSFIGAAPAQSGEAIALDAHERNALNEAIKLLPSISALKTLRDKLFAAPQPAQTVEAGEPCAHDYVRSDRVCVECGEKAPVVLDDERAALADVRDQLSGALISTGPVWREMVRRAIETIDRAASPQATNGEQS